MATDSRVVAVANSIGVDSDFRRVPRAAHAVRRAVIPRGDARGVGGGLVPIRPVKVFEQRIRVGTREHEVAGRDEPLAIAVIN